MTTVATVQVSVHDLRQNLTHYLQMVRSGQSLTITKRGKAIARLLPEEDALDKSDLAARLSALQESGMITWGGDRLEKRPPVAVLQGEKTVAELVGELREPRSPIPNP